MRLGLYSWLILLATPALAQVPGSLDPGLQLQQQLQQQLPPPPVSPDQPLLKREDEPKRPPPADDSQTLLLQQLKLTGNIQLKPNQVLEPFEPLIGQRVNLRLLQQTAARAQARLRNQGYVTSLVIIPPQAFVDGTVTVRVVESFLEALELRGGGDALQAYVRKMLQPVIAEPIKRRIFNLRDLERQLLLTRNFGAVDVSSTLIRGKQFGGSRLIVDIRPLPPSAALLADNNVPQQLGQWRLGGQLQGVMPSSQPIKLLLSGNNAFPYPGGLADGLVQVSTPLGNQGWRTDLLWAAATSSSQDLFPGPINLQTGGASNYWSLGVNYPLLLRRNAQLLLGLKGTLQNSTNDLYIDGQQTLDLSTDRLRAIRVTLDGYQVSSSAVNQLSFVFSQGFSGLGNGLAVDEVPSNPNGDANFTTSRLSLSRRQKLASVGTSSTIATLRGAGQLSAAAVPIPEQFTYGGPLYGRAFNSVYLVGDQGWTAALELGQEWLLSRGRRTYSVMPFAWYDAGQTGNKEGNLPTQSASTYGVGLRGSLLGTGNGFEVGWGIPGTNTLQPKLQGAKNSIVYFRLATSF